jgi:hypothetical protein
MMTQKLDFDRMSRKELRNYVLTHREEEEALLMLILDRKWLVESISALSLLYWRVVIPQGVTSTPNLLSNLG